MNHSQSVGPAVSNPSECVTAKILVNLGPGLSQLSRKVYKEEPGQCTAEGGTGDMAAMWNPDKKQWVVLSQEAGGPLVVSVSSDPLAAPGSWSRIDPVSGKTAPGFKADGTAHGDLSSISGSNPSIIRDQKNSVWHMVYARWGGGIAYSKSSDLTR